VPILASDPVIAKRICEETERRIDIVLSDLTLPRGVGTEFWNCVRSRFPMARVVYMSGYLEDRMEDLGHERRALFLQKPFSEDRLIAILNRAMRTGQTANG
jgi:DNA-binding NtrC family response regulator